MKFLFALIYRRWLWNDFHQEYDRVLEVRGWRTALVESRTDRRVMTPCFLWFK